MLLLFNWRIRLGRVENHAAHIIICIRQHYLFSSFAHSRWRYFEIFWLLHLGTSSIYNIYNSTFFFEKRF